MGFYYTAKYSLRKYKKESICGAVADVYSFFIPLNFPRKLLDFYIFLCYTYFGSSMCNC
jgi:hypothetical protein